MELESDIPGIRKSLSCPKGAADRIFCLEDDISDDSFSFDSAGADFLVLSLAGS